MRGVTALQEQDFGSMLLGKSSHTLDATAHSGPALFILDVDLSTDAWEGSEKDDSLTQLGDHGFDSQARKGANIC